MDSKSNLPPKDDQSSKGVFPNKGRNIKESKLINNINDLTLTNINNSDITQCTTHKTKIKKERNILENATTCTRSKEEIKESIILLQAQLKRRQEEIKSIEAKDEIKLNMRRLEIEKKKKEYEYNRNQTHISDNLLLSLIREESNKKKICEELMSKYINIKTHISLVDAEILYQQSKTNKMTASVQVQVDSDDFNENRSTAEYKNTIQCNRDELKLILQQYKDKKTDILIKEKKLTEILKNKKKSCLFVATYCKRVKDKIILKSKKDKKKEQIHYYQDYIQNIQNEIQLVGNLIRNSRNDVSFLFKLKISNMRRRERLETEKINDIEQSKEANKIYGEPNASDFKAMDNLLDVAKYNDIIKVKELKENAEKACLVPIYMRFNNSLEQHVNRMRTSTIINQPIGKRLLGTRRKNDSSKPRISIINNTLMKSVSDITMSMNGSLFESSTISDVSDFPEANVEEDYTLTKGEAEHSLPQLVRDVSSVVGHFSRLKTYKTNMQEYVNKQLAMLILSCKGLDQSGLVNSTQNQHEANTLKKQETSYDIYGNQEKVETLIELACVSNEEDSELREITNYNINKNIGNVKEELLSIGDYVSTIEVECKKIEDLIRSMEHDVTGYFLNSDSIAVISDHSIIETEGDDLLDYLISAHEGTDKANSKLNSERDKEIEEIIRIQNATKIFEKSNLSNGKDFSESFVNLFKAYDVGPVKSNNDDNEKSIQFDDFSVSSGAALLQKVESITSSSTYISIPLCRVNSLDI